MLEEALALNADEVSLNGARPPAVAGRLLGGRILPFCGGVAAGGTGWQGLRGVVASRQSGGNVELGEVRREHRRNRHADVRAGRDASRGPGARRPPRWAGDRAGPGTVAAVGNAGAKK